MSSKEKGEEVKKQNKSKESLIVGALLYYLEFWRILNGDNDNDNESDSDNDNDNDNDNENENENENEND